jgi:putative flippase GtrA
MFRRLADRGLSRPLVIKMVSFAGVGLVNSLIDFGVFVAAFQLLKLSLVPSNVLAWFVAVSCSYVMNAMITFGAESGRTLILQSYLRFVGSGILGVTAATTTLVVLSNFMPVFGAKLLSILVGFVCNFAMSHFVVFRPKLSAGDRAHSVPSTTVPEP